LPPGVYLAQELCPLGERGAGIDPQIHLHSKSPRRLRDAHNYRSVPEKAIACLLLDLGHIGPILLPSVILSNIFIIVRHDHGEDLRLLLPVREAFAVFQCGDDLPCGLQTIVIFDTRPDIFRAIDISTT
jgi:hypothetical protein